MRNGSSSPVTDPEKSGKNRRRQQLSILAACVLIATALWFLRALEKNYTTRVEHPVRFINLPDNMLTLNPLPQRLSLEVSGLGFSVLKHNWNFSKTPLVIDLKPARTLTIKRIKGYTQILSMNPLLSDFSTQLKDLKVVSVFPDTVTLRFAVKMTKKVPVIPVLSREPASRAFPDSLLRVNPDSVVVVGPDLILDTLHAIHTLPVKPGRAGHSFNRSADLENLHQLVRTDPAKVTVWYIPKN